MSETNLEQIQNLLRSFQKTMTSKSSTVRGQWNKITCLEKISPVQFARKLNSFGINTTNIEVTELFSYFGIKKTGLGFTDFISIMETDPSTLGPKTRRLNSQVNEHETLRAFEDDFNKYCRRTKAYTPTIQTQSRSKKITRPNIPSKGINGSSNPRSSRRQKNSNRPSMYSNYEEPNNDSNNYEENIYENTTDNNNDIVTFTYEPCKTVLERSLPRNSLSRDATLKSFSNTAIQRQFYDGTVGPEKANDEYGGTTIKELVTKISDSAYILCKNSRECYYKWRDPHHDQLDATDLVKGLKHDNNVEMSLADAQRVIDRYGGPMNLSTFSVMLHDGSHFNPNKSLKFE